MCVCVCRLYEDEPAEAVQLCETLLQESDLDPAVRVGDVYGFLVEHHCQQGNYQQVCLVMYNTVSLPILIIASKC